MNWYSKRALLGAVYVSTELFMITDRSANYADTWAFMNRRLEDVDAVGKLPAEFQAGMKSLGNILLQMYRSQISGAAADDTATAAASSPLSSATTSTSPFPSTSQAQQTPMTPPPRVSSQASQQAVPFSTPTTTVP
jgi:hypothetical protein